MNKTVHRLTHCIKRLVDSNDWPWTLPLPPWYPARDRQLRRLRMLARRRLRAQLIARQGWLPTLTQSMAWPAISVLKAFLAVRDYKTTPPAKLRQIFSYCWLQWAHNFRIADQEDHWLTQPEWRRHITGYVPCREHQALIDLSMPAPDSPDHIYIFVKLAFARFCLENKLPTATILAWGRGEKVHDLRPLPADDLVLKPSDGGGGIGVEILRYQPAEMKWLGVDGVSVNTGSLAAYAHSRLGNERWLVQMRLRNADSWRSFTPGALATVRVVTGRIESAPPFVLGAYLRMPKAGADADNLCLGGIGAILDAKTGILNPGHTYRECFIDYTHHPDTGARIPGTVLPNFDEIMKLAIRAHVAAGRWHSIGWDIALTPDGAILIEANLHWAIIPGLPIAETPYLEIMQSALQVP